MQVRNTNAKGKDMTTRTESRKLVDIVAREQLAEMGAKLEKREDQNGETKSGWWLDGVYLAKSAQDALRATRGN